MILSCVFGSVVVIWNVQNKGYEKSPFWSVFRVRSSSVMKTVELPRSMTPTTGSCRKDTGKSPYPSGKHRKSLEHGSSTPTGNFSDFSGGFLPASFAFWQEPGGKHWKNPEKFRPEYCFHKITGITRNRPFPDRTVWPG